MSRTLAFRWLTCWAAIFAVLFTALAPGLGQAATKLGFTEQYIAICTSTGMKYVTQYAESTDCSYCQGSTHSAIPISLQATRFDTPAQNELYLESSVQLIPLHLGWRLPPPRAPPASV